MNKTLGFDYKHKEKIKGFYCLNCKRNHRINSKIGQECLKEQNKNKTLFWIDKIGKKGFYETKEKGRIKIYVYKENGNFTFRLERQYFDTTYYVRTNLKRYSVLGVSDSEIFTYHKKDFGKVLSKIRHFVFEQFYE